MLEAGGAQLKGERAMISAPATQLNLGIACASKRTMCRKRTSGCGSTRRSPALLRRCAGRCARGVAGSLWAAAGSHGASAGGCAVAHCLRANRRSAAGSQARSAALAIYREGLGRSRAIDAAGGAECPQGSAVHAAGHTEVSFVCCGFDEPMKIMAEARALLDAIQLEAVPAERNSDFNKEPNEKNHRTLYSSEPRPCNHSSKPSSCSDWKQKPCICSDEYFDQVYFPYQPTQGTLTGYHQYDAKLEDPSRKSIDAEIARLHALRSALRRFPRCRLIRPPVRIASWCFPIFIHAADAGSDSPVGEKSG
jgi:hypothetical protein